jgi:RNA polymerase sigma factor (sigma-70 family)
VSASQPFDALRTEELLVHVRGGDEDAWREVYRRYRVFLSIAARSAANAHIHDVEDILQTAFLSAWSDIQSFSYQGKNSFRSWLSTIVVRKNIAELKRRSVHSKARPTNGFEPGPIDEMVDISAREPNEVLSKRDEQALLARCLEEELNDLERELIMLRHYERMTSEQIADIVELSPHTVRRRYKVAADKIQRYLEGHR